LYKATRSANPTATSEAATVIIKKTKILPSRFKEVREKVTSAKLMPLSINSRDMRRSKRFLLKSTPKKPMEKRQSARIR
tara:strand:+ start:478 stop:714 length:237 start_codon:yes stop_codon:yes gene_type:complete